MTRRLALVCAVWCALSVLSILPLLVGAAIRQEYRRD